LRLVVDVAGNAAAAVADAKNSANAPAMGLWRFIGFSFVIYVRTCDARE
jgi:hypothetical protein